MVMQMDPDRNKKVTIYDLTRKKIIFETEIQNKELIGRLESGIYNIINGYIYYGNEVIKIRYDLIEGGNSQRYPEDLIFDQYKDIFALKDGQKILSQCPLDSIYFHRLVYIV